MYYKEVKGRYEDVLKSTIAGTVDLIVADPPYNLQKFDGDYGFEFKPMLLNFVDILRDGGTAIVFNNLTNILQMVDILKTVDNLDVKGMMIWHKTNPAPSHFGDKHYSHADEWMLYLVKPSGAVTFNGIAGQNYASVVYNYPTDGQSPHPTSKPLRLIEEIVLRHSNVGNLVLEPFGGGRPVLDACKLTYRSCISYEIHPELALRPNKKDEDKPELTKRELRSIERWRYIEESKSEPK